MSQTVATFEAVGDAIRKLREIGEKPSAAKVMVLIDGGSKTTVLAHMKRHLESAGMEGLVSGERREYLAGLVDPLVAKIAEDAERLARDEAQERLDFLRDLNGGLVQSLDEMALDLDNALERAAVAEARVLRLEAELSARSELDEQLDRLSIAVRELKGEPPATPAMQRHVEILIELDDGPGRADLHRRLVAEGYSDKVIHAGRHHAVRNGYVEEREEPPRLYVTSKGQKWLAAKTG